MLFYINITLLITVITENEIANTRYVAYIYVQAVVFSKIVCEISFLTIDLNMKKPGIERNVKHQK